MKKVILATQLIEKHIAQANNTFDGFPSERQLAENLGLSRDTVRTAVKKLTEQGTLTRKKNGRLKVADASDDTALKIIGFATPINSPGTLDAWKRGIVEAFEGEAFVLRPVAYSHWSDPVIQEALNNCDGLFFVPPDVPMPPWLKAQFKDSGCKVVVLFQDESEAGLPSAIPFSPAAQRKLFDTVRHLGHQQIHCLNTQRDSAIIQGRIDCWKRYLKEHKLEGRMLSLIEDKPMESAYQLVRNGLPAGTALFCTTTPAAIGVNRALIDMKLQPGHDISVFTLDGENMARFLWPSLTSMEMAAPIDYIRSFSTWMMSEDDWQGNLLVELDELPLFEGESTGPPP